MYTYPPADNAWLTELRKAIEVANNAHNACDAEAPITSHLSIDRALQVTVNQLENRLNPKDYANNQTIQDALRQVRTTIAERLSDAGASLQLDGEPQTALSQAISKLPELQAQRLMNALFIEVAAERDQALKIIFDPPDISIQALEWQRYIALHSLGDRLGANSISYKISSVGDPPEILKVEYRLGNSRHMDSIVRATLPDLVTPIAATRLLVGPGIPSKRIANIGRTLMVTTFCEQGGARDYANRLLAQDAQRPPGDTTFFSQSLEIAKQMSAAFQAMERNNLYFPDGKLSNWLVDTTGANAAPKLRIADTKSFLRCAPNARADLRSEPDNVGAQLVATPGYCFAEVLSNNTEAQYIHAGIFGRNLYKFLTGITADDTAVLDCSNPIFQKRPCGFLFAELIQELTQVPAHNRPTVKQASAYLQVIEGMLDPRYKSFHQIKADVRYNILQEKKRELKSLFGPLASDYYSMTLAKIYIEQEFDLDRFFTAANASLDAVLLLIKSTQARHLYISTSEIIICGIPLFPDTLLMKDLNACIKNIYHFDSLAELLAVHNTHLQQIERQLPSLRALEDLISTCKDPRFCPGDTKMEEFLASIDFNLRRSSDLSEHLKNVMDVHSQLTAVANEPEGSLIQKIRALIQELPNKQGVEAQAIKALQKAAIEVPVKFRADLYSNQGEPEVSNLTNALARVEMIKDPSFNTIVAKLQQLNDLTKPIDNSEKLFKSLVDLSENSDVTEGVIKDLNELMENALKLAVNVDHMQKAIRDKPTVYFEGEAAFTGSLLSSDQDNCIMHTHTLSTLIDGLTQHKANLTQLMDLEDAGGPKKLMDLTAYMKSKRVSSNDEVMNTFLQNTVGAVFNEKDLSKRITMLKGITNIFEQLRQSYEKPENIALQKKIAEKISQSEGEAAAIEAAAIAVPVHKRFMANQNDPAMHKLLVILEGGDLDATQEPLSIRI